MNYKVGDVVETTYVPMKITMIEDDQVYLESIPGKMMRKMSIKELEKILVKRA